MTDQTPLQKLQLTSYLSGSNAVYIEGLYDEYLQNPQSVDKEWQEYFKSIGNGGGLGSQTTDVSHKAIQEQFRKLAQSRQALGVVRPSAPVTKQEAVDKLIINYRRFGHLDANIDPLGSKHPLDSRLTLSHYGLSEADAATVFDTRQLLPQPQATLQEIYAALQRCYSGTMGIEYSRIADEDEREWLRVYVERKLPELKFAPDIQRQIMKKLIEAEGLENYLDSKYPGQKRFSVEGNDSLIPMLDDLVVRASQVKIDEVVICMAHRGRLNVLLNIMGQAPLELFQEFEGTKDYGMTTGDVKYHRGFSADVKTDAGPIHLSLAFNPSHLEFINPVVMGSVRARQDRETEANKNDYAIAVMIHGDAAFAGQGIVMETLSMSQTRAYEIGGSLHVIVNNQIGFTTSNPRDARSSLYCSDLAKMIDAPVVHVNADDPEACVKAMIFALHYRMKFHKDFVIDLVGYRRHGHQEVDEPRATQPVMYQVINNHPTARNIYAEKLLKDGVCTQPELDQWFANYRSRLDEGRQIVETLAEGLSHRYIANWAPYIDKAWTLKTDTTVSREKLLKLGNKLCHLPENFSLQRNVEMIFAARKKMVAGTQPLDWGCAEMLAYASLIDEGYTVRLSGEDSRRGTFFHRHSTVFDQNTGEAYASLAHINGHAKSRIFDSLLSEAGALGFEYGYSTADPNSLTMWEAQFGDFANGAQVIIDQFISSGAQKWKRLSGLVMLLPHGYEGMGPEHSSARLERYLQLCAQDNIQVCVPSTPAQIFHLLRRQVLREFRAPLIVMSPKSLLRNKLAVSSLDDLAHGQLQLIIPEMDDLDPKKVTRIVMCSGKVYFELLTKRRDLKLNHVAIIRIEQLYPFPYDDLKEALKMYPNAIEMVWCQEEPKNQGAWFLTRHRLQYCLPHNEELIYAGRESMAAPAGGYPSLHQKQQLQLIDEALGGSHESRDK